MGQLGGIVVAYLAVVVVAAFLAGIPQAVGGGLFRGIRSFFGLLKRDSWFAFGMQLGVLAVFLVMVLWADNPLPISVLAVLASVLLGLQFVLILARVSVAPLRTRWMAVGVLAAILVIVIRVDIPMSVAAPLFFALVIVLVLARVIVALWPDKKRPGAR